MACHGDATKRLPVLAALNGDELGKVWGASAELVTSVLTPALNLASSRHSGKFH